MAVRSERDVYPMKSRHLLLAIYAPHARLDHQKLASADVFLELHSTDTDKRHAFKERFCEGL
jgi:hypothetical protein